MSDTDTLAPLRRLPEWLLAATDSVRVAHALRACAPDLGSEERSTPMSVRAGRARLKKDRWTVRYEVTWVPRAGASETARLVGVLVPPGRPAPEEQDSPASFASPGWKCWLAELRLDLAVEPPDDELPAMSLLTDPHRSRAMIESAMAAQVPGCQGLRIATCAPRVASYSPASRATVVYRLGFPDGEEARSCPDVVVAKTYHGNKGRVAWDGMRAVWDTPLRSGRPVRVAEPLAFLPDLNVLLQGPVPEEATLKGLVIETFRTGDGAARERLGAALDLAADGLATLHGCGAAAATTVAWDDELSEVRQTMGRLGAVVPELSGALDPLLAELVSAAASCPADPVGPAHRSFRPAQVLLSGDVASIIDFDGFCLAEPALDVALFRSTLRDIALGEVCESGGASLDDGALQRRADEADELCDVFLSRYAGRRPVSPTRVALFEALDLLTVVLHSWTKVKPARLRAGLILLERHLGRSPISSTVAR